MALFLFLCCSRIRTAISAQSHLSFITHTHTCTSHVTHVYVGDCRWPPTTPFATALSGFCPSPLVTLRTLKADVIAGVCVCVRDVRCRVRSHLKEPLKDSDNPLTRAPSPAHGRGPPPCGRVIIAHTTTPLTGLAPGEARALDALDPRWQVNGRFGVVQFAAVTPE